MVWPFPVSRYSPAPRNGYAHAGPDQFLPNIRGGRDQPRFRPADDRPQRGDRDDRGRREQIKRPEQPSRAILAHTEDLMKTVESQRREFDRWAEEVKLFKTEVDYKWRSVRSLKRHGDYDNAKKILVDMSARFDKWERRFRK
jgi:hypothetical protein